MNIRPWPVVNHGIGKHEIDIPLKLERVSDGTVFHFHLDRFEVDWTLDNFMVVGCFGRFDRIVENITVPMLRNLGV